MPAIDALSVRTRVHEQLQGHTFRTIIDAFVDDVKDTNTGLATKPSIFTNTPRTHRSEAFANAMAIAETYYLSPEMHDICQEASQAEDFPTDETILREDPPSEAGFLYLPARFRMVELRGRVMIVHAIVWLNNKIWYLCDRLDPDDEMNRVLNAAMPGGQKGLPRYDLMAVAGFDWGKPMPKFVTFERGVLPTSAELEFKNIDGQTYMFTDALVHPGMSKPIETVSPDLKFLLTIWRMMQQTLTAIDREEPGNKAVNRYADKAGLPSKSVHVIQLRRREVHATGSGKPLNVRFPVRGHWRRIWCGPADNRYQRAVYVHGYIKGPDNAPLINRERINALVR